MKNATYNSENGFLLWEENFQKTSYDSDDGNLNHDRVEENKSYDVYNFFPDAAS